jgi:HTH-type transcriptional regulator, sugar sensing transcriptional regulator
MINISMELVQSLKTLGLSDYEARVYSALVHYGHAEAKELVNYLNISKPSVYSSLESLQTMGLAIIVNSKPAMYQAVTPEIAVKILMDHHETAAKESLKGLKELEKDRTKDCKQDSLWTTYGKANIDHKIREILRDAENDVYCLMSDHYLPLMKQLVGRKLRLKLIIISDDPKIKQLVQEMFHDNELDLLIITHSAVIDIISADSKAGKKGSQINMYYMLELIVDDREFFLVPPVEKEIAGLYTNSEYVIALLKLQAGSQWEKVLDLTKR